MWTNNGTCLSLSQTNRFLCLVTDEKCQEFNFFFCGCRAKAFLLEVLQAYSTRFMKASRMLGDQLALVWVVKSHLSLDSTRFAKRSAFVEELHGVLVLFLPCSVYNWSPPKGVGQFHGMPLDVKVVHFRDSRKRPHVVAQPHVQEDT